MESRVDVRGVEVAPRAIHEVIRLEDVVGALGRGEDAGPPVFVTSLEADQFGRREPRVPQKRNVNVREPHVDAAPEPEEFLARVTKEGKTEHEAGR